MSQPSAEAIKWVADMFKNGPIEGGVATGIDEYTAATDAWKTADSCSAVYNANYDERIQNSKVRSAFAMAATLAFSYPHAFVPGRAATTLTAQLTTEAQGAAAAAAADKKKTEGGAPDPDAESGAAAQVDHSAQLTVEEKQKIVALTIRIICACKINWWKLNHHTGQNMISGYLKKMLDMHDIDPAGRGVSSALWKMGHWAKTRVWMSGLGVPGLELDPKESEQIKLLVKPSADLSMRIASNPAGTARFCDMMEGIRQAAEAPQAAVVPAPEVIKVQHKKWSAAMQDIKSEPATYHVGAGFLTKNPRAIPPEHSPVVCSWIKAILNYGGYGKKLLEAQVFKEVAPDVSTTAALNAIKPNVNAQIEVSSITQMMSAGAAAGAAIPEIKQ